MTLDAVQVGDKIIIDKIGDKNISVQAIRLGISEGSLVECIEKLPKGPVIIKNHMQEIAIGRKLAEKITIRSLKEA